MCTYNLDGRYKLLLKGKDPSLRISKISKMYLYKAETYQVCGHVIYTTY